MPDDTAADIAWFDPDATTFGDRLTGAREAAGLDVEALAAKLGVKPAAIRAWEEDRSEPRANRIAMLAGLMNVSLVWLLTGTGEGPADADPVRDGDLLAQVRRMHRDAVQVADGLRRLEARLAMAGEVG